MKIILTTTLISISSVFVIAQEKAPIPIHQLSLQQVLLHKQELAGLEKFKIQKEQNLHPSLNVITSTLSSLNLINFLNVPLNPVSWNQGPTCGNCWVWGSTVACSIAASNTYSTPVLLTDPLFIMTCNGGWPSDFVKAMNSRNYFDDFNYSGEISLNHRFAFSKINYQQIPNDYNAKAAIKSTLLQHKAVIITINFPEFLEDGLKTWWNQNNENNVWTNILFAGSQYQGAGHTMCIVGFDDSDNSWILQNSWGQAPNRLNGLLKIPQDLDYDKWLYWSDVFHIAGGMYKYEMVILSPQWILNDHQPPTIQNDTRWNQVTVTPARDSQNKAIYYLSSLVTDNIKVSDVFLDLDGTYYGQFLPAPSGHYSITLRNSFPSGDGQAVSLPINVYAYDTSGNKSIILSTAVAFTQGTPLY